MGFMKQPGQGKRRGNDGARLPNRRDFLQTAAAAAFVGGCGVAPGEEPPEGEIDVRLLPRGLTPDGANDDPETTPEAPLASFPLGLASGDATPWSSMVWTRYAGAASLVVAVWQMDGARHTRVLLAPAVPVDGFVHVDVIALTPGAVHRYAFMEQVNGALVRRSPIGRFRTAPAPDALVPVTFGAVSCTANGRTMSTLERAGARTDLDLFCLLGDTSYNDGAASRTDFRGRWAENLGTTGYRRLRQNIGLCATWDDHEVTNDWNPETTSSTLVATATGAFFEHLPIRRSAEAPNRVYRKFRWGSTAEFFVLDSRSERRPSTRNGSGAQYLSRAQMDWLKNGLATSPAVFKVVLNSVPITNFPGLFDFVANDRWEGYPAARNEILGWVDGRAIPGVLWVAGDFHMASTGRVSASGAGSRAIEVLAGPGAQVANPLGLTLLGNRQFDYVSLANNYASLALDPMSRQVRVTYRGSNDSVLGERVYML
jgi:alkaline phosphatase D